MFLLSHIAFATSKDTLAVETALTTTFIPDVPGTVVWVQTKLPVSGRCGQAWMKKREPDNPHVREFLLAPS